MLSYLLKIKISVNQLVFPRHLLLYHACYIAAMWRTVVHPQALEVVKVERDQFELTGNSSDLTVTQFLVVLSTDQMQPIAYAYIAQIDGSRILAKPQTSLNSKHRILSILLMKSKEEILSSNSCISLQKIY